MRDSARGLLRADADGELTGDDGSTDCGTPKRPRIVSSSVGTVISTSLKSDERKVGCPSVVAGGERASEGTPFTSRGWLAVGLLLLLEAAEPALDGPASVCRGFRLVRGRLRRRSGSGAGSCGDAVVDRDFLFRPFGVASRALSMALQARRSSRVSSRGGNGAGCGGATCWSTTP